jgi:hypothetical protein
VPSLPPTLLTKQRNVCADQRSCLADLLGLPKLTCVRRYAAQPLLSGAQRD